MQFRGSLGFCLYTGLLACLYLVFPCFFFSYHLLHCKRSCGCGSLSTKCPHNYGVQFLDGLFSFSRGAAVPVLLEDSSQVASFSLFTRYFLGCSPSLAASLFFFWFLLSPVLLQPWGFRLQVIYIYIYIYIYILR